MPGRIRWFAAVSAAACCLQFGPHAALAQHDAAALLREGQKQLQSGDRLAAQASFERAVVAEPQSYDAHYALGRVLDLNGRYAQARKHFEAALAVVPASAQQQALTAIAVSYVFEGRPDEAAKYYQKVLGQQRAAKDPEAGATANAIARVYLEAGDIEKAKQWYQTGRDSAEAAGKEKPEQKDLREFRWFHAQARIAARQNDPAAARRYMTQARTVLDKGTNEDQKIQWPYLAGYVAFHAGDFKTAIEELESADQRDPFILGLIAQAHDKLGQKDLAREYFKRVLATPAHTINAAYSWPLAKEYLGEK